MKEFNYKKALWITAGVLVVLIVVRAVLFFTAKPKVTVNYVAEYNRLSRPENYNPEDNAAELYQKAFDAFIEMPEALVPLQYRAELTAEEEKQLKQWLDSNAEAFDYFRLASQKPYYWIERFSDDNSMLSILLPELSDLTNLGEALICNSEYKCAKHQYNAALDNLLICYRAGMHKCRSNQAMIEHSAGYRLKNMALQSAFDLISRHEIENATLSYIQQKLRDTTDKDCSVPDVRCENLFWMDVFQRTFVYSRKGNGRWAWKNELDDLLFTRHMSGLSTSYDVIKERLKICLIGPTQKQVIQKLEDSADLSNRMMLMTPWEIKNAPDDYDSSINEIKVYHTTLQFTDSGFHLRKMYHETKTKTYALIAVLAVLRYHRDYGRYLQALAELIDAGYLQAMPMDPYSDGPLVYHVTADGFTLYSVGEDFVDNHGTLPEIFGFPVPSKNVVEITEPDIVYWPVYREEDFPAPPVDPNNPGLLF